MRPAIVFAIIFVSVQISDGQGALTNSRLTFFDIDLLRYAAEDKKGNVMISPASIKSTLAMLLEGAEGATAAEIKIALRVSPVKDDFREELSLYVKALQANTTNLFLHSANALFISKKLKLKREYERMVQMIYNSEVGKLDFNDPKSSVDTINAWVYSKTQGLIPTVVDEVHLPPNTEMLITNALYFKAAWKYGFNVKTTHSDCFYNDGICTNVAMMDLQAELNYAYVPNLRAHALELPYQGDRYSMILLVPQDRDAGVALIRDLPYIGLPQISDLMEQTDVILTMPKFNVEYSENMIGALKKMRINTLFTQSANLSGIYETGDSAYLNSMLHSVHMKVDEVGTVAAAATTSMVVPLINIQVQLRVDRPFLFFIRDNKLGLILFEGKIEEPTEFVETGGQGKPQPPSKTPLVPIEPFTSQSTKNQAAPTQLNFNQAALSQPNVNQASPTSFRFGQGGPYELHGHSNQEFDYQSNVHFPSQSQPISSTISPVSYSETKESQRKSGGISGWFRRLGGYF